MTSEPLKGKDVYYDMMLMKPSYREEDIKSAVEWLKNEIRTNQELPSCSSCDCFDDLIEKINETFDDVMKK